MAMQQNGPGEMIMPYVSSCQTFFEPHRDRAAAEPMKKYLRDKFDFLGIKSPRRKELLRQFLS